MAAPESKSTAWVSKLDVDIRFGALGLDVWNWKRGNPRFEFNDLQLLRKDFSE